MTTPEAPTAGSPSPQFCSRTAVRGRRLTAIAGLVVGLMTLLYFGSIVDPSAHLHGLPVAVVNEDSGATTPTGRVDIGHQVVAGLTGNSQITSRLAITIESLSEAQAQMDRGAAYAAVVIPATSRRHSLP